MVFHYFIKNIVACFVLHSIFNVFLFLILSFTDILIDEHIHHWSGRCGRIFHDQWFSDFSSRIFPHEKNGRYLSAAINNVQMA